MQDDRPFGVTEYPVPSGRLRRSAAAVSILALLIALSFASSSYAQERPDALRAYRDGRYDEAIRICLTELESQPMNMDSYTVLCWSLVRESRFDEAASYAEKARALNRYDPRIAEILAESRYAQGRNEEALKLFNEYVALAPEGGRIDAAYYYMGEIYLRMGRFRHADIALTTAVRYAPSNAAWWTRLGYARERAGDQRYAAEAYGKALSLDPRLADARRGLDRVGGTQQR